MMENKKKKSLAQKPQEGEVGQKTGMHLGPRRHSLSSEALAVAAPWRLTWGEKPAKKFKKKLDSLASALLAFTT